MGKKSKQKKIQISQTNYSTKFEKLYESKTLSDFTIKLNSKQIPAHKVILQQSSKFFSDYFEKNKNSSEITIKEDETSFKDLLKFMYTGCFDNLKDKNFSSTFILFSKVFF
jgi:hypothetical protein